jgi:hypothetical protein
MGTSYSFNSGRVQYTEDEDLSEISFYVYRSYAYTNGVRRFPFSESDYNIYSWDGSTTIARCVNCYSVEFSITREIIGIASWGIIGASAPSTNFFTPTHKYLLDTEQDKIQTPICITDNFPITFYFDLINFGKTTKYNWSYSTGEPCKTLHNTPGLDMKDILNQITTFDEYGVIKDSLIKGTYLVLKKELWYDDTSLLNHCLSLNEYTDYHCNGVMFNYCSNNLSINKCVAWMDGTASEKNTIGLDLYLPYCQSNLYTPECSYFSQASKNYNIHYRDQAIQYFCNNNPNDVNCKCANSNVVDNNLITYYLGPKACWLSSCTLNNLDEKYMFTEDLKTRESCKVTSCSISIANLELSNDSTTTINLINQCLSQDNVKQILGNNQNNRFQYSESFFINVLIFSAPFFIFIIMLIFIIFFIKKNIYKQILKMITIKPNKFKKK